MSAIPEPFRVAASTPAGPPPTGGDWIPVSTNGDWWWDGRRWETTVESPWPPSVTMAWVPVPPAPKPSRPRLLIRAGANIGRTVWTIGGLPIRVAWFVIRPALRVAARLAYAVGFFVLVAYLLAHALPH